MQKTKRFLKCLDCDYINEINVEKCIICGSKNLVLYVKKDKRVVYYFISLFSISIFFLYLLVYFKANRTKLEYTQDITFVSEKIPSNYYTYISSLKKISSFNEPDENDVNTMINALRYDDSNIREISCRTLKKWNRLPPRYNEICLNE